MNKQLNEQMTMQLPKRQQQTSGLKIQQRREPYPYFETVKLRVGPIINQTEHSAKGIMKVTRNSQHKSRPNQLEYSEKKKKRVVS